MKNILIQFVIKYPNDFFETLLEVLPGFQKVILDGNY